MSTSPAAVPTTPSLHTGESYQEKAWRKFREQPLVPIGTLVTCGALIMATVKMRRGDSQSLNNWLRVRVISQGATIAAVCAGTYALGSTAGEETKQTRQLDEIQAHREARAGRDRKEFEDRLKDAERQWKETEGALSGRQSNSNVAKGDSTSKALPSVEGQVPRSTSSQSSASWWWFKWPWGGSSASRRTSRGNQKSL